MVQRLNADLEDPTPPPEDPLVKLHHFWETYIGTYKLSAFRKTLPHLQKELPIAAKQCHKHVGKVFRSISKTYTVHIATYVSPKNWTYSELCNNANLVWLGLIRNQTEAGKATSFHLIQTGTALFCNTVSGLRVQHLPYTEGDKFVPSIYGRHAALKSKYSIAKDSAHPCAPQIRISYCTASPSRGIGVGLPTMQMNTNGHMHLPTRATNDWYQGKLPGTAYRGILWLLPKQERWAILTGDPASRLLCYCPHQWCNWYCYASLCHCQTQSMQMRRTPFRMHKVGGGS